MQNLRSPSSMFTLHLVGTLWSLSFQMISFEETMVTSTVEPNPCPTAAHGSHTSGVSHFALLGLVCRQRRNQAQCSGSGNIPGRGLQGEGTVPANCTRLLCLQHRFIPGLQCLITGKGAHFVHASARQGSRSPDVLGGVP